MGTPHPAPRVLIVDDHEGSRLMAARYLAATGWHVRVLEHRNEALAMLATRAFDAILVDLRLEDDDSPEGGMRVAEAARAAKRSMNIVVLSGHAPTEEEHARLMKSADTFLQKPQPMAEVEKALRGRRRGI